MEERSANSCEHDACRATTLWNDAAERHHFRMTADLDLLRDACRRSVAYLASIDERNAAPDQASLAALAAFDETLPEKPTDPRSTLALLDSVGGPATTASAGPNYFGFVTGGTYPVALASAFLTSAWDRSCQPCERQRSTRDARRRRDHEPRGLRVR